MVLSSPSHAVPALLLAQAESNPNAEGCFRRSPDGTWTSITWGSLWEQARRVGAGFRRLGLNPGDRLAICARTRIEWQVAEMAAFLAGATVVGIEPHASAEHADYVLRHCGARFLVADDAQTATSLPPPAISALKEMILLDAGTEGCRIANWHSWQEVSASDPIPSTIPATGPDETAVIIYTSGTTGQPKAISYTHRQLLLACEAIGEAFPEIGRSDSLLCWLPMGHSFQKIMNLIGIAKGAHLYYEENPRDIMTSVLQVQPSLFVGVPRFYERVYEGIQHELRRLPRPAYWAVQHALCSGDTFARHIRERRTPSRTRRLTHDLIDRLVLRRIRGMMGRNLRFMVTGSAPTPIWLLEFFHSIGLLLLEGYAMSENALPMAANRLKDYRFGSVGKPFAANDLRIAEDGEILVRGPGVLRAYYGEAEDPQQFTADGFYRTGDLGRFDEAGFLYLVGRKREMIKTSTGRRISPAHVEAVYAQSPYLEQVVVVGNGRKHLVGLIALRATTVEHHLKSEARTLPSDPGQWDSEPQILALVDRELERLGCRLASHERIIHYAILTEPLSIANGELTPTLKIRREVVATRYADLIERLYREDSRKCHRDQASPGEVKSS